MSSNKGKNQDGCSSGKKLPCYCYSCGKPVKKGAQKCTNSNCYSHENNNKYSKLGKSPFCTWCQKHVNHNGSSKGCPNCGHNLHGMIASPHKYTMH